MKRYKTLVLLSGGPDSAVLLAWAKRRGPVAILEMDYPGRPAKERQAAARLTRHYKIRERYQATLAHQPGTVVVRGRRDRGYIPGRNLAFHANALSAARQAGAARIAAGHLGGDGESFRDARRGFFDALEHLANRSRQAGEPRVLVLTPFAAATKADVWRQGLDWGVPLAETWSCQRDGPRPCGRCEGCRERADAATAAAARRARPGPERAQPRRQGPTGPEP